MQQFARYAIYYAPEPGPLASFGAAWLGWDTAAGTEAPHPRIPGLTRPVAELTATPRKYGLHGTIKPPFRLATGSDAAMLEAEARALCARLAPIRMQGLELAALGGFLALKATGDPAPLEALAAACVEGLDRFRAPAPPEELARRRTSGLSARQEANLLQWGYPYVMEEFRFHITLTGRLPAPEAEATRAALAPILAPLLPEPFVITSLCLAGEDATGRFHLLDRYPLQG